tara:strand:- start:82 stop:1122 length:1041 start_codon:yes stop_codon:yes gene_type:complete
MKNNTIFCWCSNLEFNNGEGILGRTFAEKILNQKTNRLIIKTNHGEYLYKNNKFLLKKKNFFPEFLKKYFLPFYGIFFLLIKNAQNYKTSYINYLPLWNFAIFFLLPKKTILGPITGTTKINSKNILNFIFRKYLMKIFFKISLNIIYKKFTSVIFSTENLKHLIEKKYKQRYFFNFCFQSITHGKNLQQKNIDFIFYLKNHKNKTNSLLEQYIKLLAKKNYRIYVVGDNFKFKKVKNLGFIKRNELKKILKKTKFAINSGENLYSLFALDCYSSNVITFNDIELKPKNTILNKNNFRFIDLNNINSTIKKLTRINKVYKVKKINNKKIKFLNYKNKSLIKKMLLS